MNNPDATGEARYHRCGDKMCLMFRLEADRIAEVRFTAFGCGPAKAAASVATTLLTGLSIDEARQISAFQLHDELGGLPTSKRHALLMVLECVAEALGPRTNSNL